MLNAQAIPLMNEALWLVLLLSGPPILAASIVGLLVAIFQSATQLQEQTLQYAAKFLAIVVTIFMTAALLGGTLYGFGDKVFTQFPALSRQ
jgi:type III secretion protein S